jgi:class 3 adenylate cyclase
VKKNADLSKEVLANIARMQRPPGAPASGPLFTRALETRATKLAGAGSQRWTFTATGPTTNVAARFAGGAQGNEIVVGPTTAERIKPHFVLESLGAREFKNVSAPIHVYRGIPPGVYEKIV